MSRTTNSLADADLSVQEAGRREVKPYRVVCTESGVDPSFTDPERRVRYFDTKAEAVEWATALAEKLGLALYSKIVKGG